MRQTAAVLGSAAACLLIAARAAPAAHAQAAAQTPPGQPPTQAIDTPEPERLFGTWGGLQTSLEKQGVNLQLDALTEFAGNVSGGTRQGATFANQVGLQADVNWERLAGLTGLSTHVVIVSRSGTSDSGLFGDNLLPVQEVYGSGGNVVAHLVSAYAQETLLDKTFDIAAGRMNVENDFASSPLYCSFNNNGLCGDPKALPGGDIGHSAYPDAVWAARLKVQPLPDFTLTTGVYQVNQGLYSDANFRTGFKFDDSQTSGVYLPVEILWSPTFGGDAKLTGHYKLGFGYDTSGGHKDFGNDLAADGVPGYGTITRTGNTQVWALADQMLIRNAAADNAGLIALGGFTHNDPNNTAYAEQYFGGLVDRGFWAARPQDAIGVLVLYNTISGRLANVQNVEQALDLPYSNKATGVQSREAVFEVNYEIHVFRGVTFRPDFQYVLRPNAERSIPDAAVLGFKAHVTF